MNKNTTVSLSRFVALAIAAVLIASLLSPTSAQDGLDRRDGANQLREQRNDRQPRQRTRLREGTRITDQLGHFEPTGDGAVFRTERGGNFGCLPNLNLERVVRMLRSFDNPENVRWSVSGLVTEFSGRNYVLLSKAIYKANTDALLEDPRPKKKRSEP